MVRNPGLPVYRQCVTKFFFNSHSKLLCSSVLEVRHSCDQADNLDSYTWTEYDVRQGGVQVIKDSFNNVKITTEFLKVAGGDHGGSWAVRFKGEPIDQGNNFSPIL